MHNRNSHKSVNIFCLPYAGGNKYSYREFSENAPASLNLITLDYPGRVPRIKEPLISNIDEMVEDLYRQIKGKTDHKDYAIYGHSMGGLISYLLTRKLIENKHKAPLHLFITGTTGPSAISRGERKRHLMAKPEFLQEMKDLDGLPEEILQSEELLSFFEPILRADFRVCENYVHRESDPIDIPITVITGTEEDMETEDVYLWQKETSTDVDFIQMPGKHFFIFKFPSEVLEIISNKLFIKTKSINYG
ncbi:MAG: thioesterase [Ignavibacteria bacterium]|nr:thioesterase [Ignavibacteria bacterium]